MVGNGNASIFKWYWYIITRSYIYDEFELQIYAPLLIKHTLVNVCKVLGWLLKSIALLPQIPKHLNITDAIDFLHFEIRAEEACTVQLLLLHSFWHKYLQVFKSLINQVMTPKYTPHTRQLHHCQSMAGVDQERFHLVTGITSWIKLYHVGLIQKCWWKMGTRDSCFHFGHCPHSYVKGL